MAVLRTVSDCDCDWRLLDQDNANSWNTVIADKNKIQAESSLPRRPNWSSRFQISWEIIFVLVWYMFRFFTPLFFWSESGTNTASCPDVQSIWGLLPRYWWIATTSRIELTHIFDAVSHMTTSIISIITPNILHTVIRLLGTHTVLRQALIIYPGKTAFLLQIDLTLSTIYTARQRVSRSKRIARAAELLVFYMSKYAPSLHRHYHFLLLRTMMFQNRE